MTTDTNNNNKISLREYDKELPLISVIMPAYNSEATIEKAVLSCTGQSYPNVEIIIVDNGSSDETLKVANKLREAKLLASGSLRRITMAYPPQEI